MTEVFISYSRKDTHFVKQLHAALKESNRETWVDWEDIPLTADWWQEIKDGIEAANAFVFVISPDSVISKVCRQEVDHAVNHNKRLIPIVYRIAEDKAIHPALVKHNWIFFGDGDDFNSNFQKLLHALDTDLDRVRSHTRLLVRANEWDKKGQDDSFLLRGRDLEEAEQWLTQGAEKQPLPTQQQREYVNSSRKAETARQNSEIRRQRIALGAVTSASIVATVLAVVAFFNYQNAVKRELIALSKTSEALFASNQEFEALIAGLDAGKKLERSIWAKGDPEVQAQVMTALQQAVSWIEESNRFEKNSGIVWDVAWSPDGQTIATSSQDKTAKLWQRDGTWTKTLAGHSNSVRRIAWSPDGQTLASASWDRTVKLWSKDGRLLKTLSGHKASVRGVAWSPDGQIATASGD